MCVRTPPACCISSRAIQFWGRDHEHLEGDPVPPKLFLAPAKDGGAPQETAVSTAQYGRGGRPQRPRSNEATTAGFGACRMPMCTGNRAERVTFNPLSQRNGSVDGAVWQGRAAATPTQQRSNEATTAGFGACRMPMCTGNRAERVTFNPLSHTAFLCRPHSDIWNNTPRFPQHEFLCMRRDTS
jgi:hypothetical protein